MEDKVIISLDRYEEMKHKSNVFKEFGDCIKYDFNVYHPVLKIKEYDLKRMLNEIAGFNNSVDIEIVMDGK